MEREEWVGGGLARCWLDLLGSMVFLMNHLHVWELLSVLTNDTTTTALFDSVLFLVTCPYTVMARAMVWFECQNLSVSWWRDPMIFYPDVINVQPRSYLHVYLMYPTC
jgi:hypothetical protein